MKYYLDMESGISSPGSGQNSFLYRVDSHQTEDPDLVLLADPVGPVLGLQVLVGVPVAVENDDSVGGLKS